MRGRRFSIGKYIAFDPWNILLHSQGSLEFELSRAKAFSKSVFRGKMRLEQREKTSAKRDSCPLFD